MNSSATYSPSCELLFWREGSIYAREFDPESLRLGAEPQRLVNGVGFTINEWATFSVSAEGTLVYHRGAALPWRLEWRDRFGRLLSEAAPYGEYFDFALSRDGSRVLYVADNIMLWVRDLVRGTDMRLSFEEVDHFAPAWDPRGDWIAYVELLPGIEAGSVLVRTPSSGVGDKEVLYRSTSTIRSISWSPNGRWVVLQEEYDALLLLDLESGETRIRVDSPGLDLSPALSPDGQWLAYSSNESGRQEVYVVPTFDGADKWQVSNRGGIRPQWSPEGDELFFLGLDNDFSVATFAPDGEQVFGLPQPLFSLPDAGPGLSYRISPDGRLLVRVQRRGGGENFTLIQNWPRLLEGRRR